MHSSLVMALAGAKGTITLAIIFTLPLDFPQRDLIVFLGCGVIVCTLLLATFVVPVLAPKKRSPDEDLRNDEVEVIIGILRSVTEELTAHQTPENRRATQAVVRAYNERISRIKEHNGIDDEPNTTLRIKAVQWEEEYVLDLINKEEVHPMIGYKYLSRLDHIKNLLKHHSEHWSAKNAYLRLRALARSSWHRIARGLPETSITERTTAARLLQIKAAEHVIDRLQQEMISPTSNEPIEDVNTLLLEYQRLVAALRSSDPSITTVTRVADKALDVERIGLRLELERIRERYEEGDLSRTSAKRLRENVYLMQVDLEDNV